MDKDIERMAEAIKKHLIPRQNVTNGETKRQAGIELSKFYSQLEQAGIYKRYRNVTFENIEKRGMPDSKNIRENYEYVKAFAQDLNAQIANGKGLILAGHYGTMKTTMAVAVLRKWLDSGHGGLIVPMCSLIDNLNTMRILNREEFAKYDQRIRSTPLLVLDDLGGEDMDNRVKSKIDSILTERYNKMLTTIITTNKTKKELEGTYSERVMDRLKNTAQYLAFDEDSQRRHNDWNEEG